MRKTHYIKLNLSLLFVTITLVLFVSQFAAAGWDPGPMPKKITTASYDVGGGAYIVSAGLGEGIHKKFGIKMRSLPVGTGTSRILNVRVGNCDFGLTIDGLFASEGLYDFKNQDWGPQPLRMIYISNRQSAYSFATSAKSGIKTIADVKGKRVPWLIGSPFTQLMVKGSLAYAELSIDDVKRVEVRSIGAMYQALIDGKVDASPLDSTSSSAYRLESSPKGIYWIPFPKDNKEGWNRFRAVNPQVQPVYCKYGAGFSKEKARWIASVPFPQYFVYENADEKKVYWIVKMIAESFDEYKDIAISMPWHKLEDAVQAYSVLPYHPGAIRYFKEKGVWNAQLEKNQSELIDRQSRLKKLWIDTVEDALSKGIKAKQFPKFWLKNRQKAFPDFWVQTEVR